MVDERKVAPFRLMSLSVTSEESMADLRAAAGSVNKGEKKTG